MGRHNLHSGGVEIVQDVLVQLGIDERQLVGLVGVGIDLVLHIEVVKGRDADERLRLLVDMWCLAGSLQQQVADELPLHVVADGHLGMDDDAVVVGGKGEVGGLRTHEVGVGDGDDLVLTGTDAGHQHGLLDDEALSVAILDEVTLTEGAHIGHHHTGHDVTDNA